MATQLDPVTRLPLLSDSIDQIPLGSQIFPWQDVKPTALPPRSPMYPDDVLPTVALIGGQNKLNPDQHQTAYTDGAHALLVRNVAASGGGGAQPYHLRDVSVANAQVHVASLVVFDTGASVLYAASWSLWIDTGYGALPVSPCQVNISVRGFNTNTGGHIFTMSLDDAAGAVANYSMNSGHIDFGPGIDLSASTFDTEAYMYGDTPVSSAALRCNIVLVTSAP